MSPVASVEAGRRGAFDKVAADILSSLELDATLLSVLNAVTATTHADIAGILLADDGGEVLRMQIDAFQESRNLLLTKKAHADSIPGLEILANDVRCTHAAAIAQIDPDQVFYLRSRGLSEDDAKRLVIEGFLEATVERFEAGSVREAIAAALERRLEAVLG
ncbi:MAG: SufD family Fe-S cluster assembly protein [Vicinamibacteria bacterium]